MEQRWIPVTEGLPEEHNSIFAGIKGTDKWNSAMFEKTSGYVIATVMYKDGTVLTERAHTTDGQWRTDHRLESGKVIAWMPFPEPYRGDTENVHTEKQQTNADRIRSMTDEELAVFCCKVKADYQWVDHEYPDEDACEDWEEWLQAESEG